MGSQIHLDFLLDGNLAVRGPRRSQIGNAAMPEAVERLQRIDDADDLTQPFVRDLRCMSGPLAVAVDLQGGKQRPRRKRLQIADKTGVQNRRVQWHVAGRGFRFEPLIL